MQDAKLKQAELRRELNRLDLELELTPVSSIEYALLNKEVERIEKEYAQATKQVVMAKFL